jgi:(S)-ureidoglycine aminohydrolase
LFGQNQKIEATAHNWKNLSVEKTKEGLSRKIYKGSSIAFDYTEASAITLKSKKSTSSIQVPEGFEELLIIKEGTLQITLDGKSETLGTGSVVVAFAGSEYKIKNSDKSNSTYYSIRWKGDKSANSAFQSSSKSIIKNWEDIEFKKSDKGGRRNLIREPTPLLSEFEMHVTTLNEGMKSHDPHTHIEPEIILVRFGEVEEYIDGKTYRVGPGSLIFLESNIPHGIKNVGKGACEYYAFKWQVPDPK